MRPNTIPLVAIAPDKMKELKARQDFVDPLDAMPEVGPQDKRTTEDAYILSGQCVRFRLTQDADRAAYAKLSARIYEGRDCILLWEERFQEPNDGLVAYINYLDLALVHHGPTGAVKTEELR